jgi:hypothetical protein
MGARMVYAGIIGIVFKSTDGGSNSIAFNRGVNSMPGNFENALAIGPSALQTAYAGAEGLPNFQDHG